MPLDRLRTIPKIATTFVVKGCSLAAPPGKEAQMAAGIILDPAPEVLVLCCRMHARIENRPNSEYQTCLMCGR